MGLLGRDAMPILTYGLQKKRTARARRQIQDANQRLVRAPPRSSDLGHYSDQSSSPRAIEEQAETSQQLRLPTMADPVAVTARALEQRSPLLLPSLYPPHDFSA